MPVMCGKMQRNKLSLKMKFYVFLRVFFVLFCTAGLLP